MSWVGLAKGTGPGSPSLTCSSVPGTFPGCHVTSHQPGPRSAQGNPEWSPVFRQPRHSCSHPTLTLHTYRVLAKHQLLLKREALWAGPEPAPLLECIAPCLTTLAIWWHVCLSHCSIAWPRPPLRAALCSPSFSSGGGPCLQTATEVLTLLINQPPTAPRS